MTNEKILALPMQENDSGADTIKGYLKALLKELWCEGEGFSGKRPFGNSGWEYDLYKPLIVAGFITGKLDEYGYIESCDHNTAGPLITRAIESL